MAFQQQRPRVARPLSLSSPAQQELVEPQPLPSPQRKRPLDESEEWVLFSPSAAGSAGRTQTTSTERTPRTAGLSRLSDFGSLDTAARSDPFDEEEEDEEDNLTCQGTDPDDYGEAEDLDSLDDGLHAFHEPADYAQQLGESSQPVFPTHDGLGTFPESSAAVQEQLWQFERYNVSSSRRTRHQRRRSSVQKRLDALEEAEELEQDERRQRIERWRLEQSRALLEEIERETRRRRRMSRASTAKSATGSVIGESGTSGPSRSGTSPDDSTENESFWQRFTRRVIRDLMGIDENLLSVIFGESLPPEALSTPSSSTTAPKDMAAAVATESAVALHPGESWEHRLLERIARELGLLVNQLSEHPGAFSTYLRTQEPAPYAGLSPSSSMNTLAGRRSSTSTVAPDTATASAQSQSTANVLFSPSLPPQPLQPTSYSEASLWGIEEEPEPELIPVGPTVATAQAQRDREYWERDLDVKMVFNFLKDRFSSRPPSPVNGSPPDGGDGAFQPRGIDGPASQQRAALIRQHHPLVSKNMRTGSASPSRPAAPANNATTTTTSITVPVPVAPVSRKNLRRSRLGNRNTGSSCASQSTRKSKRSGSSRNYWDLGGSIGSGPAGTPGAAGSWGEV